MNEERFRFDAALQRLYSGTTSSQVDVLVDIQARLEELLPGARLPAVIFSDDGLLLISWSYVTSSETFTLDIRPDGQFQWFGRARGDDGDYDGSDSWVQELPEHAWPLLVAAATPWAGGR